MKRTSSIYNIIPSSSSSNSSPTNSWNSWSYQCTCTTIIIIISSVTIILELSQSPLNVNAFQRPFITIQPPSSVLSRSSIQIKAPFGNILSSKTTSSISNNYNVHEVHVVSNTKQDMQEWDMLYDDENNNDDNNKNLNHDYKKNKIKQNLNMNRHKNKNRTRYFIHKSTTSSSQPLSSSSNKKKITSFLEMKNKLENQLQTILSIQKQKMRQMRQNNKPDVHFNSTTMSSSSISSISSSSSQLEKDVLNLIWSSQNVQQIHSILFTFITFSKLMSNKTSTRTRRSSTFSNNSISISNSDNVEKGRINLQVKEFHHENDTTIITYEDFQYIGPNIASAALRRMIDISQQPTSHNKISNEYNNDSNEKNKIVEEMKIDTIYIPILVHIVSNEIMFLRQQGDENLYDKDTYIATSFSSDKNGPTFKSKAKTKSKSSSRQPSSRQPSSRQSSSRQSSFFIPFQQWFDNLDIFIDDHNQSLGLTSQEYNDSKKDQPHQSMKKNYKSSQFSDYSLVNILYSLSKLSRTLNSGQRVDHRDTSSKISSSSPAVSLTSKSTSLLNNNQIMKMTTTTLNDINIYPLVEYISSLLNIQQLHQLTPKRSLEILSSLATIIQSQPMNNNNYNDSSTNITSNDKVNDLIQNISNRLQKGDAIGQLNGRELSLGLWSLSVLQTFHYGMIKSFMRKLRKQAVRQDMQCNDLCKAIWSMGQLMQILEGLQQQLREQEEEQQQHNDYDGETTVQYRPRDTEVRKFHYFGNSGCKDEISDNDAATILNECETCCYTLLNELIRDQNKESDPAKAKIRSLKAMQLADILSACSRFELKNNQEMFITLISGCQFLHDHNQQCSVSDITRILWSMQHLKINDAAIVSKLIERYHDFIADKNLHAMVPKTLISVLRSIVLILPDNGRNETQLIQSVLPLFANERYLQNCNEFEVSNFMFILAKAKYYDEVVIKALCNRMSNLDIISSCTPSSASRFLWSISSLVSGIEDNEVAELLFKMFQSLGGTLLSSRITSVDASSAMWAVAKSSYSLDKGIFDHLAEMLAKDQMLEQATVQHVCQALWACGKMSHFEDPLKEKMEFGEVKPPPYHKYAIKYASFLVSSIDQMSPKDVAQVSTNEGKWSFTR